MVINISKEIREFNKIVDKNLLKKEKHPKHISYTEITIVKYLMKAEGPVYQKDLVEVTKLKKSTIAEQLDRMEEKGIINRIEDKNDRRKNKIVLSKRMLNKKIKIDEEIEKINQKLMKNVTKKELETFMSILNKMKRNIE